MSNPSLKLAAKAIMSGNLADARALIKRCIHLKVGEKIRAEKGRVSAELNSKIQEVLKK